MRIISINVKAKNAVSVHRFLMSIPMDIQRHIFWQILGDAYSQSEFLPDEEALEQLVRALSAHYYEYKWPVSELCDNLFATETKELAAILQAGNLDQLSSALMADLSLPSMKALFKEFRFFFIQDSLEGYTEGAVNNLESMIVEMLIQANNIDTKPKLNAFEKIGYLTLMANIFSKRDHIDFELFISMFYRWYCEGQILDVIFDTIYNSKNVGKNLFD